MTAGAMAAGAIAVASASIPATRSCALNQPSSAGGPEALSPSRYSDQLNAVHTPK